MEIQDKELHRVALTAIVHKDGKYLILQRNPQKKAFPGKWTVPGGGLTTEDYVNLPVSGAGQWYHAVEQALRREVREEANLEMKDLKFLVDITFIRPDGVPVVIFSYWADWNSGDVKLDEDNVNYAWVTLEEAKKYDLIEGIWDEIKMVDDILKGK